MVQGRLGGPGDYAALRVKLQALQAACALECAQLDKAPAGLHGKPLPPSRQGNNIAIERCSQAVDNDQVTDAICTPALSPGGACCGCPLWRLPLHFALQ